MTVPMDSMYLSNNGIGRQRPPIPIGKKQKSPKAEGISG
jgi:hypothetical protein